MEYKAKEPYMKLDDDENYNAYFSPAKHQRLMKGDWVEIDSPPPSLKKHLTKKKGNK